MAVIYPQGGGNDWLGTLGTIASLGGQFIPGMQWLTPLGLGIKGADSLAKGDITGALASTIAGMKDAGFLGGMTQSPASPTSLTDAFTGTELTNKWQPFLYDSTGGYGTWQR